MNAQTGPPVRPSSRIATWSSYIAGIFQLPARTTPLALPIPATRRQALLLAQDLKRNEQRIRMLTLLHEVREKHHVASVMATHQPQP